MFVKRLFCSVTNKSSKFDKNIEPRQTNTIVLLCKLLLIPTKKSNVFTVSENLQLLLKMFFENCNFYFRQKKSCSPILGVNSISGLTTNEKLRYVYKILLWQCCKRKTFFI